MQHFILWNQKNKTFYSETIVVIKFDVVVNFMRVGNWIRSALWLNWTSSNSYELYIVSTVWWSIDREATILDSLRFGIVKAQNSSLTDFWTDGMIQILYYKILWRHYQTIIIISNPLLSFLKDTSIMCLFKIHIKL